MGNLLSRISNFFKGKRTDKNAPILYTLEGCIKCKTALAFMNKNAIPYRKKDCKGEAKQEFRMFHLRNLSALAHGPMGCISFPIYVNGDIFHQGICNVLAYLIAEDRLEGFFDPSFTHTPGWIDMIHISGGNSEYTEEFLNVLRYIKAKDFKLQVDTNGKNSMLLKQVLEENLADAVIMDVLGPEVDRDEVKESMRLISKIPQYQFQTTIHPDCLPEPEEIGERALLIKEVTGSSDQPYTLKMEDPQEQDPITLIPYYEAARKHQLLTKIEYPKDSWQWEESQQRFVPVTVEKK